jgi:hypothetical protein
MWQPNKGIPDLFFTLLQIVLENNAKGPKKSGPLPAFIDTQFTQ